MIVIKRGRGRWQVVSDNNAYIGQDWMVHSIWVHLQEKDQIIIIVVILPFLPPRPCLSFLSSILMRKRKEKKINKHTKNCENIGPQTADVSYDSPLIESLQSMQYSMCLQICFCEVFVCIIFFKKIAKMIVFY